MSTIILRLAGPMASWRGSGASEMRPTASQPTRTAVEGLLRAAKGLERGQTWVELRQLTMTTRALKRGYRLWDFSTQADVVSANAKVVHKQTMTQREYIADSDYLIALEGPTSVCEEVKQALLQPVFLLSLGEKSCVPSHPIFHSFSDDSALVALSHAENKILQLQRSNADDRGDDVPDQTHTQSQ